MPTTPSDPSTRLVRVNLVARTRVEYSEVLRVPTDFTDVDLDRLVNQRYRDVDGGLYQDDPEYWERSDSCGWEPLESNVDEPSGLVHRAPDNAFRIGPVDAQASAEPTPVPESPSPSPAHEIFNAVIAQELRVRETQAAIAVRAMAAVDALRDAVHAQIKPILPQLLGLYVVNAFGTPAPLAKFNTPQSMLHSKGLQVRLGFGTRPIVLNLHLTRAEYELDEHTAQIAQMPQRNLLDRPRATLCIIRSHPEPTETVKTVVGGVEQAPELVKAFLEALAPYLVLPGGAEPRGRR